MNKIFKVNLKTTSAFGDTAQNQLTKKYIDVENKKAVLLQNGDYICFEINSGDSVTIDVAGNEYSFIRKARFLEEAV